MIDTLSMAGAVIDAARNRGRLALAESKLALRDALGIISLMAAALLLLMLVGLALTLAFAALVWDMEHRVLYLCLLGIGYGVAAYASVVVAKKRVSNWHPLEETSGQLAEDCEALRNHFSKSSD
ncbi:MAG: phage holin family protein [Opitutaceae bacterium]|nr:phage holin family protein [Opitutaceae bacterium]